MYRRNQEQPESWSVPKIAQELNVREQRVHAFLTLMHLREKRGYPMPSEMPAQPDKSSDPKQSQADESGVLLKGNHLKFQCGNGEQYVAEAEPAPTYVASNSLVQTVSEEQLQQERDRDDRAEIECAHLNLDTPNVDTLCASLPPAARRMSVVSTCMLCRHFKERLHANVKRLGEKVRNPNEKRTPKRPQGGFGLLVVPKGEEMDEPYVAYRDGQKRALTQDEYDQWIRQYPQSFRKKLEQVVTSKSGASASSGN